MTPSLQVSQDMDGLFFQPGTNPAATLQARCLPTLDVTKAPDGRGELRFQTAERSIVLRRFDSLDEAWRQSRGVCGEFSRLVALIPSNQLEDALQRRNVG